MIKDLEFRGSTYKDLQAFPPEARRDAGYQLGRVQEGDDPEDWKPMPSIGSGVREIRVHQSDGAFRAIYVAKFEEAIFVLHCLQKKTEKTSGPDIELADKRYRELIKELGRGK
jgi:phage-related protein